MIESANAVFFELRLARRRRCPPRLRRAAPSYLHGEFQSFRNAAERAIALNPMDENAIASPASMLYYQERLLPLAVPQVRDPRPVAKSSGRR